MVILLFEYHECELGEYDMKKILVADNHQVVLKFMHNLLEKAGYDVKTAVDGLSALKMLDDYSPDVIFIDLIMPNIDGKDLCRIIRSIPRFKNIYIVILSSILVEYGSAGKALGADAFIAKGPFNSMGSHVLSVLKGLDSDSPHDLVNIIHGEGEIYPREATKELLLAQDHLRMILENLSEGIIELTSDGKIIYANNAAVNIIEISKEKLLSLYFSNIFNKKFRWKTKDLFNKYKNNPEKTWINELSVAINDKEVLMSMIQLNGCANKSNIVILNDITEQKKYEIHLRKIQKIEAISTLSGGIAHNINNVFMGILGNVSLMLLNTDSGHPNYEKLKNLEDYINQGGKLTSELLAYAMGGKYQVKVTDLNRVIKHQTQMFGEMKKEITITEKYETDLWPVAVDRGQLEQVILNLYINAWQAMGKSGNIFVKTENIILDKKFSTPRELPPGRYVNITVEDTGAGMDEEILDKIFDPFFTTREKEGGTGLGLSSVYGIIKNHKGVIDVKSRPGAGTSFYIFLPVTSEKELEEENNFSGEICTAEGSILIVDDEETNLQVVKEMLKYMGYNVSTASSGSKAIDILKQESSDSVVSDFDLIILDMIMPGMDGGEVYDQIKEIKSDVKVLLASGYSRDESVEKILKRGCNGFLQKPYTINTLSNKIRDILD